MITHFANNDRFAANGMIGDFAQVEGELFSKLPLFQLLFLNLEDVY